VFHPDRYAKSSKSEQKMAHERFIEIQAAYEYLMARF
jgi:DnaJ-class molecular chaperone